MSWLLARRDLLKRLGLGAACLPLLRAGRASAAARKRLVMIQMTQGYRQASWKPMTGALASQTLPFSVEPLEAFKDRLVFLPGLTNPDLSTTSARDAYHLMFCGRGAEGTFNHRTPAGPTLDQVVGAALSRSGRPALNLGVMLDRPPGSAVPGENSCFWAGAGQPVQPLTDPYAVYRELFAPGSAGTVAARRLMLRRKSILDYVGSNLDDFGRRSGLEEREAIQGHLQSIRELEGSLQTLSANCTATPPAQAVDLATDVNYPIVLELQLKAIVAALRCGVTRVATLQLSDVGATNVDLAAFIPVKTLYARTTWRELGRNPIVNGVDRKRVVERWFIERIGGLLRTLRDLTDDGTSMLDDTIVLVGNDMEDGVSLRTQSIPWMLAGNAGGALDTGQSLNSAGQPIARVMAAICEALGVPKHPYGEALAGLKRA